MTTHVGTASHLARPAWILYLSVQGALVALLALGPRDLPLATGMIASAWLAVVAVAAGIRLHRPSPAAPWWILLAGLVLYGAADTLRYPAFFGQTGPPSIAGIADVFHVGGSGAVVLAFGLLAVSRRAFRRLGDVIDALIIVGAAAVVLFETLIEPYLDPDLALDAAQRIVSATYSMADLALLGMAAWIVLAGARPSPALLLGGAFIVVRVVADSVYGLGIAEGSFGPSSPALVLWPASLLAVGATALHPTMTALARPDGSPASLGRRRIVALGGAALVAQIVMLADVLDPDPSTEILAALSLALVALVALVIVRLYLLAVDVETHRRVLAELDDVRARYQGLVERVPAVTWTARIVPGDRGDTEKLFVSPQISELTGHRPEDFIAGRIRWSDVVHPDDRAAMGERFRARIREAVARRGGDGESFSDEYRIVTAAGFVRWVRDDDRIIRDADGAAVAVHGVVFDITERKETEDIIRVSEARYRALVEQLPAAVFLDEVAPDGTTRTLYVSPRSTSVLGWTPEAILERPEAWREIIHHDDLAAVAAERARHIASGESRATEARVARDDAPARGERWIDLRWVKVGDLDEGRWLSQGVALDITARRHAEDALRRVNEELEARVTARTAELGETRALFEDILALTPGLVVAGRYDTREITFVSGYAETLLGYTPAELPRDFGWWSELVHPEDRELLDGAVTAAFATRAPVVTHEVRYRHRDGTYNWVLAIQQLSYSAAGSPMSFVSIGIDIEGRKAAEAALTAARAEAERASRAKSEFLSSVSHELRTPLNAILGFGQLLQMAPLAKNDREGADEIVRAGRKLLRMIDEVLEFNRLETDRITLSIEPVELGPLVREIVDLARPAIDDRGATLDEHISDGPRIVVLADRQRIGQVLLNLLSNAAKYNRDGGSITVSAAVDAGRATIAVADMGVGIEPERLARIFEPFEAKADERTRGGSIGLGLALSRRLMTMMGGSLSVTSELGVGSTFTLELPLADQEGDAEANGSEIVEAPGTERGATATILYVDDNLASLQFVERVLTRRGGVRMLVAMQGLLGLELAREHRPDLILLDLHLPDVTPGEALHALKEDPRTRDIPVIALSADATRRRVDEMRELGARDLLSKPLDLAGFVAVVDGVLADR